MESLPGRGACGAGKTVVPKGSQAPEARTACRADKGASSDYLKALAKPAGDRLQQDTGPEVSLRHKANRLIYDS